MQLETNKPSISLSNSPVKLNSNPDKIKIRDKFVAGKNSLIGDDCEIQANTLILGEGATIASGARIKCDTLIIGDYTTICDNLKMDCGDVNIGDYGIIYSDCLFYGKEKIDIGHNFFLGGGSIMNAYAPLTVGRGVGLGTQSQVWTHALWGDEMEGCTLSTIKETRIDDGAWCIGHVIVGAGVHIGAYSTILPASALTKSTAPKSVWGGVPCKEITDKLKAYKDVSLDDKWNFVSKEITQYCDSANIDYTTDESSLSLKRGEDILIVYKQCDEQTFSANHSVWNVATKSYNKVKSDLEVELMMHLKKYKARFYPI